MTDKKYTHSHASFFQIDQKMRDTLRELRPFIEAAIPRVLDDFYKHMGNYPALMKLFGSGEMQAHAINHARTAQAKHWISLFTGELDEAYVQSVHKLGKAHNKYGVDLRWYIAGYSFVSGRLLEEVVKKYSEHGAASMDLAKMTQSLLALNKAVMLDLALSVSCYVDEKNSENNKKNEEKSV